MDNYNCSNQDEYAKTFKNIKNGFSILVSPIIFQSNALVMPPLLDFKLLSKE